VNFVDVTILQLAAAATRRAVFDDLSLQHVLAAAYDTGSLSPEGPYEATFEGFRVGVFTPTVVQLDGGWSALGSSERVEAHFELRRAHASGLPRVDATWQGTVIARTSVVSDLVEAVTSRWPGLHELDADLTDLPSDPAALEQARRGALLARLRSGAALPEAIDDAFVDQLLARAGVGTVAALSARSRSGAAAGALRISMAQPSEPQLSPRPFPVAVALMVRRGMEALSDLLAEAKAIQAALASHLERPRDPQLRPRNSLVVGCVVPAAVFDDADWPGAEPDVPTDVARIARRVAAADWLAPEGIAFIPRESPGPTP
jgi:hypothetical protein